MLMVAYGIKQPRFLNRDEVREMSEKLRIDTAHSYILNKNYFNQLEGRDTLSSRRVVKCSPMISKYEQPLQLLYFDSKGELISFHNNCYAGGFPKLKWNNDHQFDRFIPKTTIPITDSAVNLSILISHLDPLYSQSFVAQKKTIVVIFWSGFMLKQSKELILVARNNLMLDEKHSAEIIYVNTDNCFIDEKYANQINKQ